MEELEIYKERPSWKEEDPSYRLTIVLYTQREINKKDLQRLTELKDSKFIEGLKKMEKAGNLSTKKTSKELKYTLTKEVRAWLDKYL